MRNKDKSITIINPANSRKKDDTPTLEQLVQDALFTVAFSMKGELEKPTTDAVWPRRWESVMANGKNEAVAIKVSLQKFPDIKNSGIEMGELLGHHAEMTGFSVETEDGETKSFNFATDQICYFDFGEREVEEEVGDKEKSGNN